MKLKYRIGNVLEVTIEPDEKDEKHQKFTYEFDYLESQDIGEALDKVVSLLYLYSKSHKSVLAKEIEYNLKCNDIYIEAKSINTCFNRLTKTDPWGKYIVRQKRTGYVISDLIKISDSSAEYISSVQTEQNIISFESIKDAGERWYKETKTKGNRFSTLLHDFNPEILPLVGDISMPVHTDDGKEHDLMEVIKNTSEHLYLIGEGGIGKTTSLYSIMKDAYDEAGKHECQQIPLFIDLSQAYDNSDIESEDHSSHFILHEIRKLLSQSLDTNISLDQDIIRLFTKENSGQAEFILLLDGLNEVSREERNGVTIVKMVIAELCNIISQWKNVRVIITSRSEENFDGYVTPLHLSGVKQETIKQYLINENVPAAKIERTLQNKQLMYILRIPLFLTLYAKLREDNDLLSRGEILHEFFYQKKDVYSERYRSTEISKTLSYGFGVVKSDTSISPAIHSFILDFIMPEIAWTMVKNNKLSISHEEIEVDVMRVLTNKSDTAYCGKYGKQCFREYFKTTSKEDVSIIAKRIIRVFGANSEYEEDLAETITTSICEFLTIQLGLLFTNDFMDYKVIHQHILDYFAALYHMNMLRMAVFVNENYRQENEDNDLSTRFLVEWFQNPLPNQVIYFIGEALGESHNAPIYIKERNKWINPIDNIDANNNPTRTLINRGLDIYRGNFNNNNGNIIWNLFQILKLTRKDLSGSDLSTLDLSNCHANGYRLGNNSFSANIAGSLINSNFLMPFGHSDTINCVHFSEDRKLIVTASEDGTAKVWNASTFEEIPNGTLTGHTGPVYSAQFSKDGQYIVTASDDGTAKIWCWNNSANTYQVIPNGNLHDHTGPVYDAQFSKDGQFIVTASDDGTAKVWSSTSYEVVSNGTLVGHAGSVCSARFSKNGEYIITASSDGKAKIWSTNTYKVIQNGTLNGHTGPVNYAEFSEDGNYIVTASEDGTARVWHRDYKDNVFKTVENGVLIDNDPEQQTNSLPITCARFSKDGKYIVTASSDGTAKVWNTSTCKVVPGGVLKGHNYPLKSAHFSADGKFIITASADCTAKVWCTDTFDVVPNGTLKGHTDAVVSAQFSRDGKQIITASWDETAKVWDADSFIKIPNSTLKGHLDSVVSAQFSKDGKYIVTASYDGTAKLWNANTFEEIPNKTLVGHNGPIQSAQFNESGQRIVTASWDGTAKIWDIDNEKAVLIDTLSIENKENKIDRRENNYKHKEPIVYAEFSKDGKYVVTASFDGTAKIWNLNNKEIRSLEEPIKEPHEGPNHHAASVFSARFSSSGHYIVTASWDGNTRVWNVENKNATLLDAFSTNEKKKTKKEKDDIFKPVVYAEFSEDEKYIVTVSLNNTADLWKWNAEKHKAIHKGSLIGHTRRICSAVFSEDGKKILTSSVDGTTKVWDTNCNEIHTIHNVTGLEIYNLNLMNLNEKSSISNAVIKCLEEYGAIVNKNHYYHKEPNMECEEQQASRTR